MIVKARSNFEDDPEKNWRKASPPLAGSSAADLAAKEIMEYCAERRRKCLTLHEAHIAAIIAKAFPQPTNNKDQP